MQFSFNFKILKTFLKYLGALGIVILLPFVYVNASNILSQNNIDESKIEIALVLGAQVYKDTPSQILSFRLDKVAELYIAKKITKILVSGDNWSDKYYNEPDTMRNYLLRKYLIPETSIFQDYAGLNTFDSCWRAKNVFNLQNIYLVTQAFHMPRALYLCRNIGLSVVPIVAKDSNTYTVLYGVGREVLASWKAVLNIASDKESLIKGDGLEIKP